MSTDNSNLLPGEKILYQSRVRSFILTGHILLTILVLGIFALAALLAERASVTHITILLDGIYILGAFFFIIRVIDFIRMTVSCVTLTDQRILFCHFPALGHYADIPLQGIEDISTGRSGVVLRYKSGQSQVISIPQRRQFVEAYQRNQAQVAAVKAQVAPAAGGTPAPADPTAENN